MRDAVYIVRPEGSAMVKIGWSRDLWRRLSELEACCPDPLTLREVFIGGRDVERAAHEAFSDFRRRGEWFEVNDETLHSAACWTSITSGAPGLMWQDRSLRLMLAMHPEGVFGDGSPVHAGEFTLADYFGDAPRRWDGHASTLLLRATENPPYGPSHGAA